MKIVLYVLAPIVLMLARRPVLVVQSQRQLPRYRSRITVTRQTGEKVLEGEAGCYTLRPEDS